MRQLKACGVLAVRHVPVRSFLLMVHANRLDLPKGHMEPGESEAECALRELEEETGISADNIQLDAEFRFATSYPVWPERFGGEKCEKTTVIFLGRLLQEVSINVTEHVGFKWVPWQPPHRIQAETIDPLLAQLESYANGWL